MNRFIPASTFVSIREANEVFQRSLRDMGREDLAQKLQEAHRKLQKANDDHRWATDPLLLMPLLRLTWVKRSIAYCLSDLGSALIELANRIDP